MKITVKQLKRLIKEAVKNISNDQYINIYNVLLDTQFIDEFIDYHGNQEQAISTVFQIAKVLCKTGKYNNLFKNFKAIAAAKSDDVSELKKLKHNIDSMQMLKSKCRIEQYNKYLNLIFDDIFEIEANNDYEPRNFNAFIILCAAVCEATSSINYLIDSANSGDAEAESLLIEFGIKV